MKIQDIIQVLDNFAPPALQESYDNSGLMVGEPGKECSGVLISLDLTEDVVEEAFRRGCNLIVSHHPIWFQARKRLNGEDYVSRVILSAIRKEIGLYSIHTNLDNVHSGVNRVICERLGLQNTRILDPKGGLLMKLVTYVPESHTQPVLDALYSAGAGAIGAYDECSFVSEGEGSFRPLNQANPFIGTIGQREIVREKKVELVFHSWHKSKIINALISSHPYEEVAWQIFRIENASAEYGSGQIGTLENPMGKMDFLALVKEKFECGGIRYADANLETIRTVAVCGGSGSFLIPAAMRAGADVLLTGDVTYHKFFDGEGRMMILDIGHFESEQFTSTLILEILSGKFPNFALHLSEIRTNPVHYY